LSLLNPSIYANDGLQFSYFRTREAAANNEESQKIKTPKTYTVSEVGKSTVFVRVATYNELCFQIVPVNLLVEEAPVSKLNDVYVICADTNNSENSIEVHTGLDANAFSFIWYRGKGDQKQQLVAQQNASLLIEEANLGWYTVHMQNANSCGIWKAFEVKRSVPPTSFMAQLVSKPYEANQTIEAKVVGDGNYKFQINGGTWQDSPRFTRLPYGVHTITVKDSFGCYSKSVEVKIIDYPRFFSPNGDGI
ncbi:MAG: hypothetical protein OIF50_00285, partial [Flavobacteriaceae bacterium]|nr:hypothetical protein [Flavobacteriaceae bacterium]